MGAFDMLLIYMHNSLYYLSFSFIFNPLLFPCLIIKQTTFFLFFLNICSCCIVNNKLLHALYYFMFLFGFILLNIVILSDISDDQPEGSNSSIDGATVVIFGLELIVPLMNAEMLKVRVHLIVLNAENKD